MCERSRGVRGKRSRGVREICQSEGVCVKRVCQKARVSRDVRDADACLLTTCHSAVHPLVSISPQLQVVF